MQMFLARTHDVKCQLYADEDQLWISFQPADDIHNIANGSHITSHLHDIDRTQNSDLRYCLLKGIVHLNIIFSYMTFNKICNLDHPVY